ncbi:hypothetical protein HanRHA438_Chr07g0317431 [Helianthus annuus]|nr:hypothetical protein HanRHA438_Chr07g0317431 [Helianthus annuus]
MKQHSSESPISQPHHQTPHSPTIHIQEEIQRMLEPLGFLFGGTLRTVKYRVTLMP